MKIFVQNTVIQNELSNVMSTSILPYYWLLFMELRVYHLNHSIQVLNKRIIIGTNVQLHIRMSTVVLIYFSYSKVILNILNQISID